MGSSKLIHSGFANLLQGGGFNQLSNANYNGSGLVIASDFNIIVVTLNVRAKHRAASHAKFTD